MKRILLQAAALALAGIGAPASAQDNAASGMPPGLAAAIGNTTVTSRNHQLPPGANAFTLEGAACPSGHRMISGSCHPGFSDRVIIINQLPNRTLNAWRCGFTNNMTETRSVWVYTLCAPDTPTSPPLITHDLSVRRFTTTPLTDTDADRILMDATTVAQTKDIPDDVACNVRLRRSGNVEVMNVGDGSLDSATEFNAVITAPGWVKAVNQINWCGSIGAGIIGCAPVPGTSLTVVRFTADLEGILWLHEFAHNKGRSHRDGVNNVMHPSIGATRRGLDQAECDALRVQPLVAARRGAPQAGSVMAAGDTSAGGSDIGPTDGTVTEAMDSRPEDVREFVRQVFFHGVPFELASQYGPEDIPALEEILRDEAEDPFFRANAAATIGMIGEERSAEVLISFIEEEASTETSPESYRAVSTAVLSLGYVANLADSERALNYLIEHLPPASWEESQLPRASFQPSSVERNIDLSKFALLGAALSGKEEAREAMRSIEAPAQGREQFQAQVGSLVEDALRENREIAEQGLDAYYEQDE